MLHLVGEVGDPEVLGECLLTLLAEGRQRRRGQRLHHEETGQVYVSVGATIDMAGLLLQLITSPCTRESARPQERRR